MAKQLTKAALLKIIKKSKVGYPLIEAALEEAKGNAMKRGELPSYIRGVAGPEPDAEIRAAMMSLSRMMMTS